MNGTAAEKPEPGSVWKHKRGEPYRVLMLANEHGGDDPEKWPVSVVYQSLRMNQVWVRRLDQWHGSFTKA
jgi:hypothetical protein